MLPGEAAWASRSPAASSWSQTTLEAVKELGSKGSFTPIRAASNYPEGTGS